MPSSLHEKPDPGALGAAGGSKGNHRSRCSWRRILGGIALILALTAAGCSQREEAAAIAEEAGQAQARGQTDLAISRWSSVLRLDKENADAYLQRAALYGQRGESEKAIADYSQFLRFSVKKTAPRERFTLRPEIAATQNQERADVLCRRGTNYARQGDFAKALEDIDHAIRMRPADPGVYVYRCETLDLKGDPEQALAALSEAIKAAPQDSAAYMYRGSYRLRRGQVDEAITDLDQSLRLNPQSAEALRQRGLAYLRLGELDKALEDANEAVGLSHKAAELYAARGTILLEKCDAAGAFTDFNHALLLRPSDPMLRAQRGYAQLRQRKLALALEDLDQAIRENPAQPYFYAWRGSVFAATNQLDKAAADLNRALQLKPSEATFYSARGLVYAQQQLYQKAMNDFEQAIALNPFAKEAYNNPAWLRATCPFDEFRNGAEAFRLASKAAELTRFKIPEVLDTLAAACAENGDFENAIKYQKRCVELTGDSTRKEEIRNRLELYENGQPFHQRPLTSVTARPENPSQLRPLAQ